ncbi:MAG TPA: DUF805 domain-containing protein [Aquaticitalea sp.]|nr:DUF805 domain-containing protein [Aquaticitalea sp.]
MFKNPFSFSGRIRRTEYGLSYIIYIAIYFSFMWATQDTGIIGLLVYYAILFGLLWFMLAQGAKRCHDLGNSGIYQLIPFYGLWLLFADGSNGMNRYGMNPKYIDKDGEINEIGKPMSDI